VVKKRSVVASPEPTLERGPHGDASPLLEHRRLGLFSVRAAMATAARATTGAKRGDAIRQP
jgi:hypothetical protein